MARELRREISVRVTNGTNKDIPDAYDGIDYVFKANSTVTIPEEVAHHIFGYKVQGADERSMFDHVCKRWGWNTHENVLNGYKTFTDDKGKKHIGPLDIWAKFDFVPVAMKFIEQPIIDTSALAEPRDKDEQLEAVG